jgi:hypothetical protein
MKTKKDVEGNRTSVDREVGKGQRGRSTDRQRESQSMTMEETRREREERNQQ